MKKKQIPKRSGKKKELDKLYTVHEVVEMTGGSELVVRKAIINGEIGRRRINGTPAITGRELLRWIKSNQK